MSNNVFFQLNLDSFLTNQKISFQNNYEYNKEIGRLIKEARNAAKRDTCYFCGKNTTSFCNSHSVPKFCLKNIAANGQVLTLNALIDNPFMDTKKGINVAGTFRLICNDCDNKIFSDYENPENYLKKPTQKMIAQIALKNNLKSISKRLFEIELYNILKTKSSLGYVIGSAKNNVNKIDLKEYEYSYRKAKNALEKKCSTDYYICYYEKLNYVVPIAFQSSLALIVDFDNNIINDIYSSSTKYRIQNIHINILPLKSETVIIMFIENGDKRYRKFYQQFQKLSSEDKLAALTLIMFMYSEDMYFSKSIENKVRKSKQLCNIGKIGQDFISSSPYFNPLEELKKSFSLNKRHDIPNLLSEKYKLK